MYTLGIGGSEHDYACALCKDGNVVVSIEEERITRRKHSIGALENLDIGRSVIYCLDVAGIEKDKIDRVVTNDLLNCIPLFGLKKYDVINHHLAHASSAYYVSPFDEAAILVVDAAGSAVEGKVETATMAYGKKSDITVIAKIYGSIEKNTDWISNSIGQLYTLITEEIGFKILQEGKTMGLAPYGTLDKVQFLNSLVRYETNGKYSISHESLHICQNMIRDDIAGAVDDRRFQVYANWARAVQEVTNKVILHMVKELKQISNSSHLCYAGGVALNSVTNGYVAACNIFEDIFIQPAANDSGTALGAALWGYYSLNERFKPNKLDNYFLGKDYKEEVVNLVRELSRDEGYEVYADESEKKVAELLVNEQIVCFYCGEAELGPRALGHRSILASVRKKDTQDILNKIKGRESFRPFAPAVLAECKEDYFVNSFKSSYMLLVDEVKEEKRGIIPAVVHVDGSARVQTVEKYENPVFYSVIKYYYDMTGVPVILNTSFNFGGEPIVETPEDALKSFIGSTVKYLYLDGYLIKKVKQDK